MKLCGVFLIVSWASFANIDFSSITKNDCASIPPLSHFVARDGAHLDYRYYPAATKTMVLLLHGSASHSRYLYPLARYLSQSGYAQVVSPDLRGHGYHPKNRGDVDYIGQLDDDLDDLIRWCKNNYRVNRIFIVGHSSGGGLALRLMGDASRIQADGYALLAPYLAHDAPTTNQNANWAQGDVGKIIVVNLLNAIGIHRFDHIATVRFNLPHELRDGTETLAYSHRLIASYAPRDYRWDLAHTSVRTVIIVGEADEAMHAHRYQEIIAHNQNISLSRVPNCTHMSIVSDESVAKQLTQWIGKE